MSQTPSNHPRASGAGSDAAQRLLHPTRTAGAETSLPPADERALSWQDALARAEQGASPHPQTGAPATAAAADSPGASACGGAERGEWSPMNPRGTAAAPVGAGASGASADAQAAPLSGGRSTATPLSGEEAADGQAMGAAGGFADGSPHMNPKELLQLKRDRLAMGLEPGAMPARDPLVDGAAAFGDALAAHAEGRLAQPVSLVQPMGVGVHSLPESERPVVEGMTLGELAFEHRESEDRAEMQAQATGSEIALEQAHLAEINTPDSLPLETIQSS